MSKSKHPTKADLLVPKGSTCRDPECPDHPEPPSPDEIAGAILEMLNTLLLLYKMDGYKSDDPRLAHLPPMSVPFAENVDRAVERFDKPALRSELVRLLYAEQARREIIEREEHG